MTKIMRITTKHSIVLLSILATFAAIAGYLLTSGIQAGTSFPVIPIILIIAAASMAIVAVWLTRTLLVPLKKLTQAAQQMAKGNLACEAYRGTINAEKMASSNELEQLVLTFESMRRRLLYLNSEVSKLKREKTLALESMSEKESALQRADAMLTGQSEQLRITNDGLSAKNEELTDAYTRLQMLDKAKSDFIAIAAHELRTPIQHIIGFVELAERRSIGIEEAWKIIAAESRRLARLSTDLLDAGNIERGGFSYEMKPLGVKEIISFISASSAKFATQDGVVTIRTELDADVKILGDKDRLVQALENIIHNAIRFGKNGTITISSRNSYNKGLVEVRISDSGPGIPSEILPVLFNKFVTRTEANIRGSGLGLFITKAIIEAHNGKIKAENNSGTGATFTILLPIHAAIAA